MPTFTLGPRNSKSTCACVASLCLGACSVPEYNIMNANEVGGQVANATGGSQSSGGLSAGGATGGTINVAGSGGASENAAGGSSDYGGTAGTTGTGGSAGGVESSGGASANPATGGTVATGGANPIGGSTATGGSLPTGGSNSMGGSANTGGLVATGGAPVAGGASTMGGALPTGGTVATGGAPATGGSTSSTGGSSSTCAAGYVFCDNFEAYTVGGAVSNWTAITGTWSIATDSTEPAGDQQVYSNKSTSNSASQAGTVSYADATIEARIKVTSYSSNSASNAAGIYLRNNGTNDYDLSLGADGVVYLRRSPTSSTVEVCSSGTTSGPSGITIATTGCTSGLCTPGWFKLKLVVAGTAASGITITGYIDPTGASGYTQALQCVQNAGTQYMINTGTAGVFSKGSAQAEYDDVLISSP